MPDIKTLAAARNVDLVDTFTKSIAKLAKMLSACDPIKRTSDDDAAPEEDHRQALRGSLRRGAGDSGIQVHLADVTDL